LGGGGGDIATVRFCCPVRLTQNFKKKSDTAWSVWAA